MAEIKSTLDIIMEKTKNLSLTEDDKRAIKTKEMEGKVRGLLVKYLDGLIDLDSLSHDINSFDENDKAIIKDIVVQETLVRIDPEADNQICLGILERVAEIDVSLIRKLIVTFQKELALKREVRKQQLLKQIQKKGITGSAVLPNLNADAEWSTFVKHSKALFQKELSKVPATRQ